MDPSRAPIRRSERLARRQHLQRHRARTVLQGGWRLLATLGLASGLVWAITHPRWILTDSDKIAIAGNQLLQTATLQQMLAGETETPQSLLLLRPERLAQRLQAGAPIARITISRSLLPLRVTATIAERAPVAATLPIAPAADGTPDPATQAGFLDAEGIWLPASAFANTVAAPALHVKGYRPSDRARWQALYGAIARAAVPVAAVDLQDANNTILQVAELGPVHLGGSRHRLDEQLQTLARLQAALPQHPRAHRVAYIDLKNPDAPAVRPTARKT